jgi:hypothetical protein
MFFEERSDGFYHRMGLLFDPDKPNIDIKYLPRNPASRSLILPRNKTVIPLGADSIIRNTFQLTSQDGTTYTEVNVRSQLDAPAKYLVDYPNGVLYLNSAFGNDIVKATFQYRPRTELAKKDFAIWFEDSKPIGIRINRNAFTAQTITETIGDTLLQVIDIKTGLYIARQDEFSSSNKARTLSYDCILPGSVSVSSNLLNTNADPEEVDFIDGVSEFHGLIPMLDEYTSAIEAGADGLVQFNLSAGGLAYTPLSIQFSNTSVFTNIVPNVSSVVTGSIGDYYTGTVSVQVGASGTLTSGIKLDYFYKDPSFDASNKFSVDYQNGVLYTETNMNPNATIQYKTACYKVAYDVALEIEETEYNQELNTINVRTENLFRSNNLVKVIWTKGGSNIDYDALKDFFSPLVSTMAFRFF